MIDQQEILNTIILTRVSYYNPQAMLELYKAAGSATEVMAHRRHLQDILPNVPRRLTEIMSSLDSVIPRAEEEMEWETNNHVECLCYNDKNYPRRLRECPDAPLMLFYKGTADLNQPHIINIVGTRHMTPYGGDLIRNFVNDLYVLLPDTLIVSGLAYGVDIHAHRAALKNNMQTVGVLAHGIDNLYPPAHLQTAREMILKGGLLTEFMTHTNADKLNFVRRNRITAGLCDATVLVESAYKGGGLITARLARDYDRDIFAFPGPVGAPYSEGCNNLIRDNGAMLITSAADMIRAMGWERDQAVQVALKKGIERELFPTLTSEEQLLANILTAQNDLQVNVIAEKAHLPIAKVTALLFEMEMKGLVKALVGGFYHFLK